MKTVVDASEATVEVIDEQLGGVESRQYVTVHLLENGWVRCFGEVHPDNPDSFDDVVSYYPPERVNEIHGHEESSHD